MTSSSPLKNSAESKSQSPVDNPKRRVVRQLLSDFFVLEYSILARLENILKGWRPFYRQQAFVLGEGCELRKRPALPKAQITV
jgi:hypothetical protein